MHSFLLYLHIIAGTISLASGPVALFNQNGKSLHRLSGKIFFAGMTVVFITAVILSIMDNIPFLLFIAVFSYYNLANGYRVLYLKKAGRDQKPATLDWILTLTTLLFNSALLIWGIWQIISGNTFGIVAIAFSIIGGSTNIKMISVYRNGYKEKNGWLIMHITGMIAGYIASVTAFLVNTVHFEPAFILWLAPSLALVPVMRRSINKFRGNLNKGKNINDLVEVRIKTGE